MASNFDGAESSKVKSFSRVDDENLLVAVNRFERTTNTRVCVDYTQPISGSWKMIGQCPKLEGFCSTQLMQRYRMLVSKGGFETSVRRHQRLLPITPTPEMLGMFMEAAKLVHPFTVLSDGFLTKIKEIYGQDGGEMDRASVRVQLEICLRLMPDEWRYEYYHATFPPGPNETARIADDLKNLDKLKRSNLLNQN